MKKHFVIILALLCLAAFSSWAQQGDPIVTLTNWDGGLWQISGTAGGNPFAARVVSGTSTKGAHLNKFAAGDPVVPFAQQWNALVGEPGPNQFGRSASGYSNVLGTMAVLGARMSISLNRDGTVKSMQPVP